MQNHLLQILTIIAMEKPVSLSAEHVRDEKVKVLRAIPPLEMSQVLLGQYTKSADGKYPGYLDDETVPKVQSFNKRDLSLRLSQQQSSTSSTSDGMVFHSSSNVGKVYFI